MDAVYDKINIPGFGNKKVLVISGGELVADFGSPDDIFVTLEDGKRAIMVLADGLAPSGITAESFKAHRTVIDSDITINTWTDCTQFTQVTDESIGTYIELLPDGKTFKCNQDGLYQFGGCVHYQNNGAGIFSSLTMLTRILKNGTTEARCSQRGVVINVASGGEEVMSYNGTADLKDGDTFTLQYYTDVAALEFFSNANFQNPIAYTLWTTYLGAIPDV